MERKCRVIMLSTTKEVGLGGLFKKIKEYAFKGEERLGILNVNVNRNVVKTNDHWEAQHLYLVCDEELKEGDWIFCYNRIGKYKMDDVSHTHDIVSEDGSLFPLYTDDYFYKVIATTDKSLDLPIVPEAFVREYCEQDGDIDLVKMELTCNDCSSKMGCVFGDTDCGVSDKKTVKISPIVKLWTRDEIKKLCQEAYQLGMDKANAIGSSEANYNGGFDIDLWIFERLNK